MSLLTGIIEPQDATGTVKNIFEMSQKRFGYIPNAIRMQSINPDTIQFFAGLSKYFVHESRLSEKFRLIANESIAKKDSCEYCVSMMQGALHNKFGIDKEALANIIDDPSTAPLEADEKALLTFILKVVEDSNSTTKEDIKELNDLGWSDKDIFDAVNFATQMVKTHMMLNALKIEKE